MPFWLTMVFSLLPFLIQILFQFALLCKCKCAMQVTKTVTAAIQKLLVVLFPFLFSEKKVGLRNGAMSNVLHFMDRPLDDNNDYRWLNRITFWLFGGLAISILCMTMLSFFRYFPIQKSSECKEFDSSFRTLYCFTNASDLPVNCTNIDDTTEVICYAFLLDLPVAIGASYGLMQFTGFVVILGAHAAKLWIEYGTRLEIIAPRHCRCLWLLYTSGCVCTLLFSVMIVAVCIGNGVLFALILIPAHDEKASRVPQSSGELFYDTAYIVILLLVLPLSFVFIPWLVWRHKDRPTYEYVALQDNPATKNEVRAPNGTNS